MAHFERVCYSFWRTLILYFVLQELNTCPTYKWFKIFLYWKKPDCWWFCLQQSHMVFLDSVINGLKPHTKLCSRHTRLKIFQTSLVTISSSLFSHFDCPKWRQTQIKKDLNTLIQEKYWTKTYALIAKAFCWLHEIGMSSNLKSLQPYSRKKMIKLLSY